jgi:hypothetical protein
MESERIPFVGLDVHFVMPSGAHAPAKIVLLADGQANDQFGKPHGPTIQVAVLTVFHPNGIEFGKQAVQDDVGKLPGSWHFMEKPSRIQIPANGNSSCL